MKYAELSLLNSIGQEFSATLNLDTVIDAIMSRVKDVLNCEASSVILYDEAKDSLVFYGASGAGAKVVKGLSIPRDKGIAGWVFKNRKPVIVEDVENDERFYHEVDRITSIKTRSIVCVPVEKQQRTFGVLEGINKIDGNFTRKDQEMLMAISRLAGISIENSIIYKNLELKNRELLEMNREMEEFVSIVSHDIQTPLAAIEGYIRLINREMTSILQTNSDLKNYIERISLNTQHLLNFIRKLLNYLKLRSRTVIIDEFNPGGVIEEILIKLEGEIRERNAKLVVSSFDTIRCDRFLFHQVLFNLIQNSLKYTSGVEQPVIEVGMKDCGHERHFYVRDNGPGLSEDEQKRIFNIYARNESRNLENGYGIGLAFVKRAVELQGGTVWFETKPSMGATFFFSLPKI
jgi:signal transduction histidine kinase